MIRTVMLLAVLAAAPLGAASAQSIPAPPAPSAPPPPASTLPPGTVVERYSEETFVFKSAGCRNRANGYYCGTGTNRQLLYQCVDEQVANEVPCPGGCNPATLSCAQEFGVKGIDPPKQ